MKLMKNFYTHLLIDLFKTNVTLFKIFFYFLFNKKKIIFIYFPVKTYSKNITLIKDELKKYKNIYTLLLFNRNSSKIIEKYKDSYFLEVNYLKFIPFSNIVLDKVNLFISSYVNFVFPRNSKNIYICHDISDPPMVNKDKEKKLFISLARLDYIFVPSKTVVNYFKDKFKELHYNKDSIPKLIDTGYLKLDNVIEELKKSRINKTHILVAPTFSQQMKDYNMSNSLQIVIKNILLNGEKVIFRPHPLDLIKKGSFKIIKKILHEFKEDKNFLYDSSTSYLNSYSKAKLLITDFSGTAYTFAYSTLRPVIFFSKNENNFQKNKISKLFYFKDRKTVGFISKNIYELIKSIKRINQIKQFKKNKIFNLRKSRIKNINKSLNQTVMNILKICRT